MDSGDSYDVVYLSSDNEEAGCHLNLNKPQVNDDLTDANMATTQRNFSKKQGHKLDDNQLSDHDGLDSLDNDQEGLEPQIGV